MAHYHAEEKTINEYFRQSSNASSSDPRASFKPTSKTPWRESTMDRKQYDTKSLVQIEDKGEEELDFLKKKEASSYYSQPRLEEVSMSYQGKPHQLEENYTTANMKKSAKPHFAFWLITIIAATLFWCSIEGVCYHELSKIDAVLHQPVPFQVFPPSLLLQYLHPSLSFDLFDLLRSLLLCAPHHILLVTISSLATAHSSSWDIVVFILCFPSPAGAVSCMRIFIDEPALWLAERFQSCFFSIFWSVGCVFLQNLRNFWV